MLKIVQNAKFDMVALAAMASRSQRSTIPASCPTRSMPAAPSICRTSLPASLLGHTCLTEKEVMGTGNNRDCLRPGGGGARHRICRRGDRCRLAALADPEATTCGRIRDHGLRDAGAAALLRVLANMERAGVKVERATLASLSRLVRPNHRAARGRDPGAGRRRVQYRLAQAARRDPVRQDEPVRRAGSTKTGAWSTDAAALEELAAEGHELPRKVLGLAPTRQAQEHLYRRAARPISTPRRAACTPLTRWPRRRRGGCRRSSRTSRTSRCARPRGARSARPSWRRRARS